MYNPCYEYDYLGEYKIPSPVDPKTLCSVTQCKNEAIKISKAIQSVWRNKFGQGPGPNKRPLVGGYMCYDWTFMFNNALKRLNLKCHTFQEKVYYYEGRDAKGVPTHHPRKAGGVFFRIHFFVEIYACPDIMTKECTNTIDDGFFNDGFVHKNPWPIRKGGAGTADDIADVDGPSPFPRYPGMATHNPTKLK